MVSMQMYLTALAGLMFQVQQLLIQSMALVVCLQTAHTTQVED
jgi:hypothetical protein